MNQRAKYHFLKIKHTAAIVGLLVLVFLSDGANSILENLGQLTFSVSLLVRMAVQGYFLLLLFRTRQGRRVWWLMLFFFAISLIGTWVSLGNLYSAAEYDFFENFKDVNKMVFFFICLVVYRQCFHTAEQQEQLLKAFEFLLLTQSVVIILGFLFHINWLASYFDPRKGGIWRFGYRGLVPAVNEISAFYLIAFFYFLSKVLSFKRGVWKLLVVMLAGVLTGTKVALALPIILLVYLLGWILKLRVHRSILIIVILICVIAVLAFVFQEYLLSRVAVTISYFRWQMEHNANWSFLWLFLTGRDYKIRSFMTQVLPKYTFFNYVFGGNDRGSFSLEMDVFEVFARFGIVGGVSFYWHYLKALWGEKKLDLHRLLFVFVWLGVSATAGHIVFSAVNGTYLPILLLAFSSFRARYESSHAQTQTP